MKGVIFVLIFLVVISFASSFCEDDQIDINKASLEELDELSGIGPVKSQAIIDTRPFYSIDDLINVYGIGPVTLEKIQDQDLACVGEEWEKKETVETEEIAGEKVGEIQEAPREGVPSNDGKIITLTTQTIKSSNNNENKSNYALYGLVGFCFVLVVLFIIRRKKYKNEFR